MWKNNNAHDKIRSHVSISTAISDVNQTKSNSWKLKRIVNASPARKLHGYRQNNSLYRASLLRQIVASPRIKHQESNLDLCYVTDYIVVTSGPSSVWPKKAYRNPLDQLVGFLDKKHGEDWAIFEFRAEGTGYPDSEVYNRIHHFPWPDHHPPPFAIIPNVMAAMRNWIQRLDENIDPEQKEKKDKRVAVIHCKAGKGRSGTVVCSYLISEEGWKKEDALVRFTERRMRAGFGQGVSIPSQLRYVGYVDRWANQMGKKYVERPVEVVEIHVYGLRDGVKVAVEGYVENGRRIKHFHTFSRQEKMVVEGGHDTPVAPSVRPEQTSSAKKDDEVLSTPVHGTPQSSSSNLNHPSSASTQTVILKPLSPIILPTSDINIDFERRNKAGYAGFTVVTSIAHVWFNAYFEGGYEGHDSGVFEIEWEAMDGIKGSTRKGTKALDRFKVVWKYAKSEGDVAPQEQVIQEPAEGEPVPESQPADWRGDESGGLTPTASGHSGGTALAAGAMIDQGAECLSRRLGLRKSDPGSANLSRASSPVGEDIVPPRKSTELRDAERSEDEDEGVKVSGPAGEDQVSYDGTSDNDQGERSKSCPGHAKELGLGKIAHIVSKMKPGDKNDAHAGEQS
ncbi:hypothetical protein ABEF92_001966 [Exophiala dermatitidis]|uniref:phosphatidylinositol-3,4,5-trisphosphate 3-phosphatase n=2 Tax=Exophiala dermatitidis TaxID=5970 RepID=H6BQQ4_EXODN|nr:protein-tyrosine phosphatase [Exophiala dermatitidis NIH/UT8656]EHY54593.1 protein-tyrosine phosphatase [Exophiala dermatitidis NIH/UT8656]